MRGAANSGTVPSNGTAEINESSNFLVERNTSTRNASLTWTFNSGTDLLDGRALVYWNRVDVEEALQADGRVDQTLLDEFGVNLVNQSQIGAVVFQYGADIYREQFEGDRSGALRPLPPEATTDVWSLYAQASAPLAQDWRLDLGLRYDDFTTEADNLDNSQSKSATSTSAALVWSPAVWATIALRYDEAFRAPTAEELYTSGTHFCMGPGFCNSFVPNPELEAEQAANVELLGQFSFREALGADVITLQASVFNNSVDNFIEQRVSGPLFFPFPDPGLTRWVNVDQATIRGFELQGSYQRDALRVKMAYGLTRGENNSSGQDLSNIPADTFLADIGYSLLDNRLYTGLRYTHSSAQPRTQVADNDAELSFGSYNVADLYLRWEPAGLPALKFDLNINNLTDQFYQRAWSQLPEAGREVIISARYSF